jgi:hypothetical protein
VEVLVSRPVKDLVAGSGLPFDDRGEHGLKGAPDRWRVLGVAEPGRASGALPTRTAKKGVVPAVGYPRTGVRAILRARAARIPCRGPRMRYIGMRGPMVELETRHG